MRFFAIFIAASSLYTATLADPTVLDTRQLETCLSDTCIRAIVSGISALPTTLNPSLPESCTSLESDPSGIIDCVCAISSDIIFTERDPFSHCRSAVDAFLVHHDQHFVPGRVQSLEMVVFTIIDVFPWTAFPLDIVLALLDLKKIYKKTVDDITLSYERPGSTTVRSKLVEVTFVTAVQLAYRMDTLKSFKYWIILTNCSVTHHTGP
ncbi:hypothetical protein BDQ17DRAFT_1334289 [Cyathus striatus]|nr:hypothetical protein BDQ17DRAFT_1334289 [Cyathus striatus]